MDDFTPKTPITLQIRKIIFEKFNDVESFFKDICDAGLTRNIAQNFTTIWLKLFDPAEKLHCNTCNYDVYLGVSEKKNLF